MAVSYASNRVTVGTYKTGTTTSNSTTTLNITSGQIVAGDIGRLVAVIPNAADSSLTQVRQITGVSAGTISIHDPWVGTIPSGTTWTVAHNFEDVHAIGNAALVKTGDRTYRWDADWNVQANGFFGDTDVGFEGVGRVGESFQVASRGILQFGIAWGGEGSATQTTGGCRLLFKATAASMSLYGQSIGTRLADGCIVNFYNCLIHSFTTAGGANAWMFGRWRGPARFIGCNFDGVAGGRLTHEASEWVQCRMSGNDNSTPAFGLAANFNRAIDTVQFYRNLVALKSFQTFSGVFRNLVLANNGHHISRQGTSAAVWQFIDCTEFGAGQTTLNGGVIHQDRSVNIVTTDEGGTPLDGIAFRVNNNADVTQGAVNVSSGGGVLPELFARRFTVNHNSTVYNAFAPFRMRYRAYGYLWQSLNAAIADPIKQSVAMLTDSNVTQTLSEAQAHTGITVTDHGGSPVSWGGKSFGITVTGNLTTNPTLTAEDIKHYLHWHLSQTAAFGGKATGLNWHDLIPMAGVRTERGDYGGTQKGVRVVDENGDEFPDILTMTADDGTTLSFAPVVLAQGSITGFSENSRIIIYNVTTDTEMYNDRPASTSYVTNYENGTGYTGGDVIDVYHVYYQADGEYATRKTRTRTVASNAGWSVLIDEEECQTYSAYFQTFGVTGEQVHAKDEFEFDGGQIDVNIDLAGAVVNFFIHELFLWDKYELWLTGNREFFQKIAAPSPTQINIGDMVLDNVASPAKNYVQQDVIQVVRTDESYPVRNPSTGGGGIDVLWRQPVLALTTGGLSPNEGQIRTWVRSELDSGGVDITKVNGVDVNGSGTEVDPWGPA